MTSSKRIRQSMLMREKNFATSTSAFIETKLTSTTNISQSTENHKESSEANQLVDSQEQIDEFHHGKSKLVQDHFEIISKITAKNKHANANITKTIVDKTQSNNEDDWVLFNSKKKIVIFLLYFQVCPVAIALRRAGYNVCILSKLHAIISFFFSCLNRYHSDLRNLGLSVVSKLLNYFELNIFFRSKKSSIIT